MVVQFPLTRVVDLERNAALQRRQAAASQLTVLAVNDDLECSLCTRVFYQPVTTPCGHTCTL